MKQTEILLQTEGYYAWLQALKPGDEVTYLQSNYWNRHSRILTVIENSKDKLILSDGKQINPKTGRLVYCRTSYSDRDVHIIPTTDTHRYNDEFNKTQDAFNHATSRSNHKFTINEMNQITAFINKLMVKRKSHFPVKEGE